jgi:uncharacterized Zn finger protein (UPF0148 family)
MKNCPFCGTPLKDTTFGNKWCPNCGKIEELKEEDEDKERTYIQ